MRQHALLAVGELERQAAVLARTSLIVAHDLSSKRAALIAHISGEREWLVSPGMRSSFDCQVLTARTLWSAALAASLAAARQEELARAAEAGARARHWAACRRGLERRSARRTSSWRA